MDFFEYLDKLPKRIDLMDGSRYILVIFKDNYAPDVWVVMYSSEGKRSLSTVNTLLKTKDRILNLAMEKMYYAHREYIDVVRNIPGFARTKNLILKMLQEKKEKREEEEKLMRGFLDT